MPTLPLPMRTARLVLERFHDAKLSRRRISQHLGISRNSVRRILERAEQAKLSWPLPDGLTDTALTDQLYCTPASTTDKARTLPDWSQVHTALARHRSLTLTQLWRAYHEAHPEGYPLSQFSKLYPDWRGRSVDLVMRQTHRAGDQVFIDYSGKKPSIVDAETGEARPVERFVAVLGASNYIYAEASLTQQTPDLCASLVRAFEFFGGVPRIVVPDNLKAAVTRFKRHDEPILNPSFQDLVEHYRMAALPARPKKPRDKGIVEPSVLQVQRRILAPMRNTTFFSLQAKRFTRPSTRSTAHRSRRWRAAVHRGSSQSTGLRFGRFRRRATSTDGG